MRATSKRRQKSHSRGGIGNAAGAQGVEIVDIIASQFDVLLAVAAAQSVEGEVENVIGLVIRQTDFENGQALECPLYAGSAHIKLDSRIGLR